MVPVVAENNRQVHELRGKLAFLGGRNGATISMSPHSF